MTTWTFFEDEDGWDLNDSSGCNTVEWTDSEGHNQSGAIEFISGDDECSGMGMSKSISPIRAGITDFSFWYKYVNNTGDDVDLVWSIYYDEGGDTSDSVTLSDGTESEWLEFSTSSLDDEKSVDEIFIGVSSGYNFEELQFWIDDVYLEDIDTYALTHSAAGIPGAILEAAA